MKIFTHIQLKYLVKRALGTAFITLLVYLDLINCMAVDHCYSDIGCFPLSDEFYHPQHRPWNVRPWHRRLIDTRFELFNRAHPEGYILTPWDRANLVRSQFNPMLETKIIIPGWLDNIRRAFWLRRLKDSLLYLWKPINIIVVHWRNFTPYTIATANTRVVGAELANLLQFIEAECNYDRSYYHLIGHSLGAHIGGYCGDRLPGLGRITALDPARPFFQGMPKSVRLDRADAKFVDAIHSDFTPENAIFLLMSFGMTTPVGHLDFYPNGPPLFQPGCLRDTILSAQSGIAKGLRHSSLPMAFLETTRYLTACDHQRSHEWFIESILNRECVFVGVRCNEFEGMINGRCTCDDSPSSCAIMGIHADQMYLSGLHEDAYPLNKQRSRRPPPPLPLPKPYMGPMLVPPPSMLPHLPMGPYNVPILPYPAESEEKYIRHYPGGRQVTRDELIDEMRQQAQSMRSQNLNPIDEEETHLFKSFNDKMFLNYLRQQLFMKTQLQQHQQHPLLQHLPPQAQPIMMRRSAEDEQDMDEPEMSESQIRMNPHPMLMPAADREVEDWYEGNSRWFLKTNNKPNYCVNQYQVLVFLGPLKTDSGMRHLRANLVISIIGTRGQLVNQRFIPRSSKLDSFTMQPFFVILEGSYSLGNIMSVAISWEARTDPDPIKATVSFQSNILENLQTFVPVQKAAPLLSKTLEHDYTTGFRWSHPLPAPHIGPLYHPHRVDLGNALIQEDIGANSLARRADIFMDHTSKQCDNPLRSLSSGLSCRSSSSSSTRPRPRPRVRRSPVERYDEDGIDDIDPIVAAEAHHDDYIDEMTQESVVDNFLDDFLAGRDQPVMAELNNIGVHLDRDVEDSIVVNQIWVSPLQAKYSKEGEKLGKVFCPPQPSYKLAKDQTVRLEPNLVGKCPPIPLDLPAHMNMIR